MYSPVTILSPVRSYFLLTSLHNFDFVYRFCLPFISCSVWPCCYSFMNTHTHTHTHFVRKCIWIPFYQFLVVEFRFLIFQISKAALAASVMQRAAMNARERRCHEAESTCVDDRHERENPHHTPVTKKADTSESLVWEASCGRNCSRPRAFRVAVLA